jgi:hypothetical protein
MEGKRGHVAGQAAAVLLHPSLLPISIFLISAPSALSAIRALSRRVPADQVPPGLKNRTDALVQETILLMPADLRPFVLLDSGNFATTDVNDLYPQVINLSMRLRKLRDLNAPIAVLHHEGRQLQGKIDTLFANQLLPADNASMREGDAGKPFVDVFAMASEKVLRADPKRVEWCGRARLVSDGSVPGDRVQVPRLIFDTLRLDGDSPVLLTCPENRQGTLLAARPESCEESVFRRAPQAFRRLVPDGELIPTAILHRPLGRAAGDEARQFLVSGPAHGTRLTPASCSSLLKSRGCVQCAGDPRFRANPAQPSSG